MVRDYEIGRLAGSANSRGTQLYRYVHREWYGDKDVADSTKDPEGSVDWFWTSLQASWNEAGDALAPPGSLAKLLQERRVTPTRLFRRDAWELLKKAAPELKFENGGHAPKGIRDIARDFVVGWRFPATYHKKWESLCGMTEAAFSEMREVHKRALAAWKSAIEEAVPGELVVLPFPNDFGPNPLAGDSGTPTAVGRAQVFRAWAARGADDPGAEVIAFFSGQVHGAAKKTVARVSGRLDEVMVARLADGRTFLLGEEIRLIAPEDVRDIETALAVEGDPVRSRIKGLLGNGSRRR